MQLATFFDHALGIASEENIDTQEALKLVASMGIELMEVSGDNIEKTGLEEMKKLLDEAGLGASTVCAYFDWGNNPEVSESDLEVLDKAKYLGARKILIIPGFVAENDSAEEIERKTQNMIKATADYARKAVEAGILPTMEEYDYELAPFCNIAGLERFVSASAELKVTFDTGNFYPFGEDIFEAYDAFKDRVGHVHLKDRSLTDPHDGSEGKSVDGRAPMFSCPVGSGALDIAGIIKRLREDGYDDIYTIEHYNASDMLGFMKKSVEFLSPLF